MFLPDGRFDLVQTTRYNSSVPDTAVRARRDIRRGETIPYLYGWLMEFSVEAEDRQHEQGDVRSVVWSDRKQKSFFLGGIARFCNHDCSPNAHLVVGRTGGLMALEDINCGDEITWYYDDESFGPGNEDCLCLTCQCLERNG